MNDLPSAPPIGVVIAVDGTSGSGKSSTSRGVASRLGMRYLDTGAMYRAVAWWVLRQQVDPTDSDAVAECASDLQIIAGTDPLAPTIEADGEDVSAAIRAEQINAAVSPVAAVPQVRAQLLLLQRDAIQAARSEGVGIVVEGRDIGSAVAPEAEVKVYLSADPAARASRRAAEEGGSDVSKTEQSLRNRDLIDSTRKASPLVQAEGAVHIDTTDLTLDEVIDRIVALAQAAKEPNHE